MYQLAISAYYHDAAACLLRDGIIEAAAQEERFSRLKHDASFPVHAIAPKGLPAFVKYIPEWIKELGLGDFKHV